MIDSHSIAHREQFFLKIHIFHEDSASFRLVGYEAEFWGQTEELSTRSSQLSKGFRALGEASLHYSVFTVDMNDLTDFFIVFDSI